MRFFSVIILTCLATCLFAQKPVLDNEAYKQWPSLESPELSRDGKYVAYGVKNIPVGAATFVIQATNNKWKRQFVGTFRSCQFSSDGKLLFFIKGFDSLGMISLGSDKVIYKPNISDFKLLKYKNHEWLCYSLVGYSQRLVMKDLNSNQEKIYDNVTRWEFNNDGIILLNRIIVDSLKKQSLLWIDLANDKSIEIWRGSQMENIILDQSRQQLVFKGGDSLWYYKTGLSKAIALNRSKYINKDQKLSLVNIDNFSRDGNRLFVSLQGIDKPIPENRRVEIWNYLDAKLQSEHESDIGSISYLGVIDLNDRRFICLQQNILERFFFPTVNGCSDTLALIRNEDRQTEPWSINNKVIWSIISVKTGQRRRLSFLDNNRNVSMSSCGKYLLYYNTSNNGYFSYEIASGKIRNLTENLNALWWDLNMDDRYKIGAKYPRGFDNVVWLKNDEALLVYDQYDIWKIDPLNIKNPINITNGYGAKNSIVFSFTFADKMKNGIGKNVNLYLNAFDIKTKNNGFCLIRMNKTEDPKLLNMGPYVFCTNSVYVPQGSDFNPVKAKCAESYLVRRMSATECPNYFSTKDFITYIRLSDLHPERRYNWLTTELHTWKSLEGKELRGILYKPENFDPNKKYPVIFHYYERKSDGLNAFLKPDFSEGNLDIPTYVSQGYIIFCPDIYYTIGNPMKGTYTAVISAANYISTLPFINSKKMGIQGHSFGAVQTNYLIAHTDLFAAAVSASGIADWISHYGSGFAAVSTLQYLYENGQARMGGSLWEKTEAYISSSPIFQIDKITTPILIMHGKKDGICPFSNAVEFFTGLRRLGKRAWLLAYPDGMHSVHDGDAKDFSIRMMQFFNHYLKDDPAPLWMTRGVDKSKNQINRGSEYDMEIKTPGLGLLKPEEQLRVDSLMNRKQINITIR